jgi:hypothetical protein
VAPGRGERDEVHDPDADPGHDDQRRGVGVEQQARQHHRRRGERGDGPPFQPEQVPQVDEAADQDHGQEGRRRREPLGPGAPQRQEP